MNITKQVSVWWSVMLLLLLSPGGVLAGGLGIQGTRVVFKEGESSNNVTLLNRGDSPYLIQSSVMEWHSDTPSKAIMVIPPLFRLEPHSQGTVRLVRTGVTLPENRESVFQFVARGIEGTKDPKHTSEAVSSAALGISLGFAVKVFWRPAGLDMTPTVAYSKLQFHRKGERIIVNNPTPYYMTFASLNVGGKKVNVSASSVQQMVEPMGEVSYVVPEGISGNNVTWTLLNDSGVETPVQKSVIGA